MDIRQSYDAAAQAYTEHLFDELEHKPLDRHLLSRFAEEMRARGMVADLGCGPGQVSRYLSELGVSTIGIDLSSAMIACASAKSRSLDFRVGDMKNLDFPSETFGGVVAFYSIVHFDLAELDQVLREMRRVVVNSGLALLSFHVGDEVVHTEDLFGVGVSLDFRFYQPQTVVSALSSAGFATIERTEREPYSGVEYPSRRCYVLARAT